MDRGISDGYAPVAQNQIDIFVCVNYHKDNNSYQLGRND